MALLDSISDDELSRAIENRRIRSVRENFDLKSDPIYQAFHRIYQNRMEERRGRKRGGNGGSGRFKGGCNPNPIVDPPPGSNPRNGA